MSELHGEYRDTVGEATANMFEVAKKVVELLCEKSEQPFDDFDRAAGGLAFAADRLAQFFPPPPQQGEG